MKKLVLFCLLLAPLVSTAQNPIQLDTVGNACHINQIGFAKDGMTYSLYGDSSLNITIQYTNLSFSNAHYSRFRSPSGSAFANRQALTDWLDTYFFADAAASGSDTSGGGATPNLEAVTTGSGNNITPNAIQATGIASLDISVPSAIMARAGSNSFFSTSSSGGGYGMIINDDLAITTIQGGSTASLQIGTIDGAATAQFNTTVSGNGAISQDDFVNLGQVQAMWKGGQSLFTADGTTTVFNITHNLGATPSFFSLSSTTPITLNNLNRTITFPDPNTMRITFNIAPLVGEDVNYVWVVYK